MMNDLGTDIRKLIDVAEPVSAAEAVAFAAASQTNKSTVTSSVRRRVSRSARRVAGAGILVAALVGVVVFQALPSPDTTPTAASAAPFLRQAARAILTAPTFHEESSVVPQPNQYVYSETEDPSGTVVKIWLSVDGSLPGVQRWTSGITGEVPATGEIPYPACTVDQAASTGCFPQAGYFPDMPTNPTALLSYLNQIGLVDTAAAGSSAAMPPGWMDNDLANGIMYLMETSYLLPAQQSALFSLMAQTPGFTIVPQMADVIGRVGVGVEWSFQGDAEALIFNPTTYALLGDRSWPGPPVLSAPYDGNALLGVSIVNSIPPGQTTPSAP
jgi:hypothetical protein